MNSFINLILDADRAKERLQRLFQSAPETEKNAGGSADNKHRCANLVVPGAESAADFLDSRHRSGTDRAHKHSVFARVDSSPCSQAGTLVSAEIGFSVWLGSPSFPFLLFLRLAKGPA
jgi:hypothetical protein